VKSQILEKFMNVHVSLKDKDAPPVGPGMALDQGFQGLKVNKANVVHSSIYFTDVDSKDGQFVAIQGVLEKA
jgi:hypothetical protein